MENGRGEAGESESGEFGKQSRGGELTSCRLVMYTPVFQTGEPQQMRRVLKALPHRAGWPYIRQASIAVHYRR